MTDSRKAISLREWLSLVVLSLLLAAVYFPGLSGPFMFDDAPNIIDNAFLVAPKHTLLDWWGAAQSSGAGAFRRPIPMLSFALQMPVSETVSPYWFKVGNLLIHASCGLLFYFFCRALVNSLRPAIVSSRLRFLPLIATALWLLNPLHLSTVLYPVQRMAQFAAFFTLLGLLSYARYRARWVERLPRLEEVLALLLWLFLLTTLAALSKENGVLLPALIAVIEVSLMRGRWAGCYNIAAARITDGVFLFGLLLGGLLMRTQWDWISAGYDDRSFTLWERLFTQARLLWEYAGWFAVPRLGELGLFHDDLRVSSSLISPWSTAIAIPGLFVALMLGLRLRQCFPWLLLGVGFFLVGHILESGPLALEMVFEHRNYLPSLSLAILLAALLCNAIDLGARNSRYRWAVFLCPLIIAIYVLSLTARAVSWSDQLQLARDSFARHPESARSAHFYANTLITKLQGPEIDTQARSQYLAIARHEFELLHNRKSDDLSALVMLFTLDSRYFKHLSDPERWLRGIEVSVASSQLLATEYAAMRVLLACFSDGFCEVDDHTRLHSLIDTFDRRYAYPHASAQLRLSVMEQASVPETEIVDYLNSALQVLPGAIDLRYRLIQSYLLVGDFSRAHLQIVELIRYDPKRRQLSVIHKLFAGAREQ